MSLINNIEKVYDNIVFNLWIGNYDRKDQDIIIDNKNNLFFIDYHLWGPGFLKDFSLCLGAYAESYALSNTLDTGWCVGAPTLIDYIRINKSKINVFEPMLSSILNLNDKDIEQAVLGLSFCDEKGNNIKSDDMIFHFKSRKNKLRHALINWINDGYPIGNRPEDELKNDNIYNV